MSSEALVGTGITIAEIGLLCLLLGWAQHMRSVPAMAWMGLASGVVLVVIGVIMALAPRFKDRASSLPRSGGSPTDDQEPEEECY